jgi:hypothetical protein
MWTILVTQDTRGGGYREEGGTRAGRNRPEIGRRNASASEQAAGETPVIDVSLDHAARGRFAAVPWSAIW